MQMRRPLRGCSCGLGLAVAAAAAVPGPAPATDAATAAVVADPCDRHMLNDLGWLQQYVRVGFFTDYKMQAWWYYKQNETTYAFLWLNSIAYANLEFVKEACPPAAMLALLLRAEERLPVRDADEALLDFAALAASAEPVLRSSWPIAEGLSRLKGLAAPLTLPEEYTVDVIMPYCNEPLDGLLSKRTGYDTEWLATRVPLQHVNLVLYRLVSCEGPAAASEGPTTITGAGSMAAAATRALPPRAAVVVPYFRSVELVAVDASPRAWEAARYLSHLATRYDQLADFTIFLHPDVFEHVNPRTLLNLLQSLRSGTLRASGLGNDAGGVGDWYGYVSLSHHYLLRPSRAQTPHEDCADASLAFHELHEVLFGPSTAPSASPGGIDSSLLGAEPAKVLDGSKGLANFGFYCCSQFMVHRDRVWRRPREWYQRVARSVAWEHCSTSYMELLWHAIFTDGQLHEAKRQERTDLPLFLRIDNFLEGTSDGLV